MYLDDIMYLADCDCYLEPSDHGNCIHLLAYYEFMEEAAEL